MTILITGGTGFLGQHLGKKLNAVLTGRNNKQNLEAKTTGCDVLPMDITNIESIRDVFLEVKPTVVIHAAATKFVDLSEKFPMECIDVNVLGTQNVARVCMEMGVKKVLGISTDKASPPVKNIYGMSKALMERVFCSLNTKTDTQFACVRYGNVAWSTGSVFPIWKKMGVTTGVLKSSGWNMRRYFFTVEDACDLVMSALNNFDFINGGILCQKMKSAQMSTILSVWCEEYGYRWEKDTLRPGDRLDEFLIGEAELEFTESFLQKYFFINPNKPSQNPITEVQSSANAERLTNDEILEIVKFGYQNDF